MIEIKRVLISVSDKTGIVELAKELKKYDVEIISTGGTAKKLRSAGIKVKDIAKITGFPELLDGRVKTLHPKIFAGLLACRDKTKHLQQLKKQNIGLIDLVVVNLYPFAETLKKKGVKEEEIIENIDIGGPSLLRAAAKNFQDVVIITSPVKYREIIKELKTNNGRIKKETSRMLAIDVFQLTNRYDYLIAQYLKETTLKEEFPESKEIFLEKIQDLRYGENPHQNAALYREKGVSGRYPLTQAKKLQGKELSFNNFLDLEAALSIVKEFKEPAAVVIKHTNPTGVALGRKVSEAYKKAYKTDPVSAFGSVVAINRKADKSFAQQIKTRFVEAIIAPDFEKDALKILTKKKNLRLLQLSTKCRGRIYPTRGLDKSSPYNFEIPYNKLYDYRRISGGLLIQGKDNQLFKGRLRVVTKRKPTKKETADLKFAWAVAKHIKSNAIVLVKNKVTIGVGAGQMSRVDSSEIALRKAKKSNLTVKGTVAASDAFFPFSDGIELLAEKRVKAIIQPGGSLRDKEVIAAADKNKIAMVFTRIRHFRH